MHEFRARIERLHVVERLGVALLVYYLTLRCHCLTSCFFTIIIIGIKFNHLLLRCVGYDI